METARYILLATVSISLFYTAYTLIFRKETNFQILRVYLLGSAVLSMLLPLISIEINTGLSFVTDQQQVIHVYTIASGIQAETGQLSRSPFNWHALLNKQNLVLILTYLYLAIVLFLLFRLIIQVAGLTVTYARSKKVRQGNYTLLLNQRFRHTFSFFRWIFVDEEMASDKELEQIITHENIHISQFHSLDIVLMELLTALMWFNPLVWKMRQEMQLVHEYLADEGVLNTGVDRLSYQTLLVNQVAGDRLISLSSSFNYSLIKKRITMMTTRKPNRNTKGKVLTLIPLAAALFVIIALTNGVLTANANTNLIGNQSMSDQSLTMAPALSVNETAEDTIKKTIIIKTVHSNNPNDTIVEETREIIVTTDSLGNRYIASVEPVIKINRHEVSPDVKKNGHKKMVIITTDEKGGSIMTETETDSDVLFEKKNTNRDTVYLSSSEKKYKITEDATGTEVKTIVINNNGKEDPNILYIINGVEYDNDAALREINPDEIISIEVLKDSNTEKYTLKDVDGVLIITTKSGKKP